MRAPGGASLPFVRKWVRISRAIVFRLSNNVVQINFFDHCKLIINTPAGLVTFIDHHKNTNTYFLESLAGTNHAAYRDLGERLTYAIEAVEALQTNNTAC
jgi:hypothetical protein